MRRIPNSTTAEAAAGSAAVAAAYQAVALDPAPASVARWTARQAASAAGQALAPVPKMDGRPAAAALPGAAPLEQVAPRILKMAWSFLWQRPALPHRQVLQTTARRDLLRSPLPQV